MKIQPAPVNYVTSESNDSITNNHHYFLKYIIYWLYLFLFIFFFLLLERGEGKRKRERNINVWLLLTCPLLGTWPVTQACALTGNQTSDPLVHRPELKPLSHNSQGQIIIIAVILHVVSQGQMTPRVRRAWDMSTTADFIRTIPIKDLHSYCSFKCEFLENSHSWADKDFK